MQNSHNTQILSKRHKNMSVLLLWAFLFMLTTPFAMAEENSRDNSGSRPAFDDAAHTGSNPWREGAAPNRRVEDGIDRGSLGSGDSVDSQSGGSGGGANQPGPYYVDQDECPGSLGEGFLG